MCWEGNGGGGERGGNLHTTPYNAGEILHY